MSTAGQDRFVENEKLFRSANERLHQRVDDLVAPGQFIPFLCECIDDTCMARIELTSEEYDRAHVRGVRGGSLR